MARGNFTTTHTTGQNRAVSDRCANDEHRKHTRKHVNDGHIAFATFSRICMYSALPTPRSMQCVTCNIRRVRVWWAAMVLLVRRCVTMTLSRPSVESGAHWQAWHGG